MDISRHYYNPTPLQQQRVQAAADALRLKVDSARRRTSPNAQRVQQTLTELRAPSIVIGAKTE